MYISVVFWQNYFSELLYQHLLKLTAHFLSLPRENQIQSRHDSLLFCFPQITKLSSSSRCRKTEPRFMNWLRRQFPKRLCKWWTWLPLPVLCVYHLLRREINLVLDLKLAELLAEFLPAAFSLHPRPFAASWFKALRSSLSLSNLGHLHHKHQEA